MSVYHDKVLSETIVIWPEDEPIVTTLLHGNDTVKLEEVTTSLLFNQMLKSPVS